MIAFFYNAIIAIIRSHCSMPSITVRNLSPELHTALRVRAAIAGRSAEAEVRLILENAVRPSGRVLLGSLLAEIGSDVGGAELDFSRDKTPAEPMSFE
jgi:antitoxin FitA